MSLRTPQLTPGEQIANMEILDALGGTGREAAYRVRFLCCGDTGEMRRAGIARRARAGSTMCRACANRAKLRAIEESRPSAPEPRAPGAEDMRGHWWPMLGPMGPRWGSKDTRMGRLG